MYKSSLLHIFYNTQKYTIMSSFTTRFEIMVAATLGKILGPQRPRQRNESYLWENQEPWTKCTLSMTYWTDVVSNNLFPHLIKITCFQKHVDGLLTDMYMQRQNILPCKKQFRRHSFNILFFNILFYLSYQTDLKKFSWKSIDLFKEMVHSFFYKHSVFFAQSQYA